MPRIVPIHYRKLVRILEMEGFSLARERGDHMIFTKPGVERPAVVPPLRSASRFRHQERFAHRAFREKDTWNCWIEPDCRAHATCSDGSLLFWLHWYIATALATTEMTMSAIIASSSLGERAWRMIHRP